jgi:pimeloyl-ACP methyl ester carboxylesterase
MKPPTLADALTWANDPAASDHQKLIAIDVLISFGNVDLADALIARLQGRPELAGRLNRLIAASRQLRRSGVLDDLRSMTDAGADIMDGRYEAYTARYEGETRKAIVVFTGIDPRIWLSLMMLHMFLKRLNTHVIYLTDHRQLIFIDGLETVAQGYEGLRDALARTLDDLGVEELHVMANSAGGFVGLRAAAELKAKSFLGMSIRTDLSENSPIPVGDFFKRPELRAAAPHLMVDLKPLLRASPWPERIILYSGDGNPIDRPHAEHLADLPNATVNLLPNHALHDVVSALLIRGDLEAVLRDFVYGGAAAPGGAGP